MWKGDLEILNLKLKINILYEQIKTEIFRRGQEQIEGGIQFVK